MPAEAWSGLFTDNQEIESADRERAEAARQLARLGLVRLEECLFLPDQRAEWEMTRPVPVCFGDYVAELVTSLCL